MPESEASHNAAFRASIFLRSTTLPALSQINAGLCPDSSSRAFRLPPGNNDGTHNPARCSRHPFQFRIGSLSPSQPPTAPPCMISNSFAPYTPFLPHDSQTDLRRSGSTLKASAPQKMQNPRLSSAGTPQEFAPEKSSLRFLGTIQDFFHV